MKQQPLISICIPAYNAGEFLQQTLDSIASQTHRNWELLIVEDGSPNPVDNLVQEFEAKIVQVVKYLTHDQNKGLPETRNTAFEAAKGDFIAICDADDYWEEDHLETLLLTLVEKDSDLSFAACRIFDSDTDETIAIRSPAPRDLDDIPASLIESHFSIQPSAVLFKIEVYKDIGGFDPSFPICNDFEFWIRAAKHKKKLSYTGKTTCHYRKHDQAMSNKSAALIADAADVIKHHAESSLIPRSKMLEIAASRYANAAAILRKSDPKEARKFASKAVSNHPSIKHCLRWIVSLISFRFSR